jgi:hypothetical protein
VAALRNTPNAFEISGLSTPGDRTNTSGAEKEKSMMRASHKLRNTTMTT